jgi:hypothetical protein
MSHLSPERLAALLDEQPTAAELAHLATCRPCSRERGAYEALSAMAQDAAAIGKPLTSWEKLAPELRHDGVIESDIGRMRRSRWSRGWLQAAAGLLLMIGGAAFGRMTAPVDTGLPTDSAGTPKLSFTSVSEAQSVYQQVAAFLAANDTANLSLSTPAAIKTRLAALDQVAEILGPALEEQPYDPVVNSLYLNAQGQREASMRMLNTASTRAIAY